MHLHWNLRPTQPTTLTCRGVPVSRSSDFRTARLSRDGNGDPIGAAVFLTAQELSDLGIDTEITDTVNVTVEDGEVRLSAEHKPEGSR